MRLGYSEDADGPWLWIQELGPRGASGFLLPPGARGHTLLAWLANLLQEQFFPESAAAWGEARPACPGHSHPAIAVGDAHEAWWYCPLDSRPIAAIGSYVSPPTPRPQQRPRRRSSDRRNR